MRILITGGRGETARPIAEALRDHTLTLFDLPDGDIRNPEAVRAAARGMDAVIHLAVNTADPGDSALTFETNVYGTYNVLCAARDNHVGKILLAASAPVHLPPGACCSKDADFPYDLTKLLQEDMARRFAQTFHMNILTLRLGHIVDGRAKTDLHGTPLREVTYCRGGWVCRYDVAQAFRQALEAGFTGYRQIDVIGVHQETFLES